MKASILSNYAQQFLNIGLRFFLIPIYVEAFGLSAYGLIGFYISISAIFVLLDFGMGYASIKLLAESSAEKKPNPKDVALLKLVELVYLAVAISIGLAVLFASELIATKWLEVDDLSIEPVFVVQLMAILLLVTWPQSLYQSFLVGQQRFVAKNICLIIFNIFVSVLMFLGIRYLGFGIKDYFLIMIVCMLLQTICLRYVAWSNLEKDVSVKANKVDLKRFFSYASGVSLFSICSLGFFQGPLFALSSMSKTSELGLYNLSMTFPFAMLSLMYPVGSVFFPKLVRVQDRVEAQKAFDSASILLVSFILLGASTLTLNMDWIFGVWLGPNGVPDGMRKISSELTVGILCYGCSMVMSNLLLSNGNTWRLASAYLIALLYLAFSLVTNLNTINAMVLSVIWKQTAFILMVGIMTFGLFAYSFLLRKWFVNMVCCLLAAGCAIFIFKLIQDNFGMVKSYSLMVWVIVAAGVYFPFLSKVFRRL